MYLRKGDSMDERLTILLKQVGVSDDSFDLFKNSKIEKIEYNKKNDHYEFVISLDNLLPIDLYDTFFCNISNCFPDSGMVTVRFNVNNTDFDIKDYFNYALSSVFGESPFTKTYQECDLKFEENTLIIEVANKAESMKLKSESKKILNILNNIGFNDVNFKIVINKEKSACIIQEIQENLKVEVKEIKKVEKEVIMGSEIKKESTLINNLTFEEDNVIIDCMIFDIEYFESNKSAFRILTLKITDFSNSMYAKIFTKDENVYNELKGALKIGNWYKMRGYTKNDQYAKELVFNVRDVMKIAKKEEKIVDTAEVKRVELHTHSFMSQMDGLIQPKDIIKFARSLGHKAVAITDHNGAQAFPEMYKEMKSINKGLQEGEEPFKVLFGTELTMINDYVNVVIRPDDRDLMETTYVVFDVETTGFNAGGGDQIIEIGAVKIKNGEILDVYSKLIDPKRPIPAKITEITKITDEMVAGCQSEEEVIKEFIEWVSDAPLVAHNAKFDISFLERAYNIYNLGTLKNTVIDTLELSRTMDSSQSRHSLSALVKRYSVEFDENAHHRADYDAKATAVILHKMLKKLSDQNFKTINDLDNIVSKDEIFKFGRSFHVNIIAKNRVGLKNLFKLISLANTKYLYKTPRIPRSEIEALREGLLISSGCYESEVFSESRSKSEEELTNIVKFYDYVEIQPLSVYDHLLQTGDFADMAELVSNIKKIVKVCTEAGVLVAASSDVHHLKKEDKIYREIIVNQKVPGGGFHPLNKKNIKNIPSYHFRTTDEMLEDFSFLDNAYDLVVTNTNKVADMVEFYEVIIDTKGIPFSPKMENSVQIVNDMVYGNAKKVFGDPLPEIVQTRIEKELEGIIKGGYDVIYLIAQKLVQKSNEDGYLVGSRGSVGSSYVATLMGITEVNPLPPHYVCPKCQYSTFEEDGAMLGSLYPSGYDLPDKTCPNCNHKLIKEGLDMPFATFLGFNADKVPDIDLNFSGEYQWKAHEYTKELFGVDNVYRAGTTGTVADKTAFGFVKGYCEEKGLTMRTAEIERLAKGCTGVKRTTGQHPGGIVVVPDYMEVFDFTPFQYPADDPNKLWRTTHFDYHSIEECLLKLDILGHDDPTTLRMLQDLSGLDVTKVDFMDKDVIGLFSSPAPLGLTEEDIMCPTGTLGIPELGTKFLLGMLSETKPKTFAELLKISGLSHGTDVWLGNAQELIKNGTVEFKDVIGCRDDIMVYLSYQGLEPSKAFKIMEFVRKGMPSKVPDVWQEHVETMRKAGIAEWYIESCGKIKYMFPKAHAAAYIISALRIAWFKVHMPIHYYAAYFSVRCFDFDIEAMIKGKDAIKNLITELSNKGYDVTNKESAILDVMYLALEATSRGFVFGNIDLKRSDAKNFIIDEDMKTLIPPFRTIDGLGDQVAAKIVEEREKGDFLSIEDLQKRGKVNTTTIEKMRFMGILDQMDESSQLSLF